MASQDTPTPPLLHSAFYRFVPLAAPHATAARLRALAAGLTGSLLLAPEGLNGAVAGPAKAVQAFEQALRAQAPFATMTFRHSTAFAAPYGRLKVRVKPELVALGVPGVSGLDGPAVDPFVLDPLAWQALLQREPRLVLIDNRNHFEARLGRFHGALDPEVDHFRDFPGWLQQRLPVWQREGRPVAMYCTGGIRCEKLGGWLQSQGHPVYQLRGGILHYLETLGDAAQEWQGECFVFDRRMALDRRLQPTPTTADQVYDPSRPDEAWRLQRARRLAVAPLVSGHPTPT